MSEGRDAANVAASAFISKLFYSANDDLTSRVSRAIEYANSEVFRRLGGSGGTTLSAVIATQHFDALFCHVGDSRVYGVSADRVIEQLSRDDTIGALIKREGGSSGESPRDTRLLQFVGMGPEMEAQIGHVPSHCRSVLLTSDGAHDVPNSVLQRVVSAAVGGTDLVRKLLSLSDMLGGRDNASAVILPLGTDVELFDEFGENELLAILPHETLSIHIADFKRPERSLDLNEVRNDGGKVQPNRSPIIEADREGAAIDSSNPDNSPASKPSREPTSKAKTRTSRSGKGKRRTSKPKQNADELLPFDDPDKEIDIQFSSPTVPSGGENE